MRPQDSPTRERKSLDGLWQFALDGAGAGREQEWWRSPLAAARQMPVPVSYNDIVPDVAVRDHVGDAWYQTVVRVPRGWSGERIVLGFDAATHRAVVWVDDARVAEHEGGYTPFEADVTDHVTPGAEARITVVVNNELGWQSVPPGIVEDTPAGKRQRYYHDFFNYAGLHRSVWLYTTPRSFVRDVTVRTDLHGDAGTIAYEVGAAEAEGLDVRVTAYDAEGARAATTNGAEANLTIEDVHPWRPGEGYLYDLAVELVDSGGQLVDSYRLPVGSAPSRWTEPGSSSTASRLRSRASASTRTRPCAAKGSTPH